MAPGKSDGPPEARIPLRQRLDGIKNLTDLIALDPDNAGAHISRGLIYMTIDKVQLAIADYTAAIAIDDSSPHAYQNRAMAYLGLEKWTRAIAVRSRLPLTTTTARMQRSIDSS